MYTYITSDSTSGKPMLLIDSIRGSTIYYNEKQICSLGFSMADLTKGQSVGVLLTKERELHWFVDGKWRGVVHVDGYPLDEPMWGVMDVCAQCKQARAEICTGESW